jgi:hypothetical protein
LAELHKSVNENINPDNTVVNPGPKKVMSERTKPALSAPVKKPAKSPAKKSVQKTAAKRR